MLLRFRSRTATSKQAEAVKAPNPTNTQNHTTPYARNANSPLFGSPRQMLLRNFTAKHQPSDDQSLISPTSILDNKPISPALHWDERCLPKSPKTSSGNKQHSWENPGGLGLVAVVDSLADESEPETKLSNRTTAVTKRVLFGSQLRIQIPPNPHCRQTGDSVRAVGCVSETESPMELSESYTCVIYHGPNPRTTHIFDNCVVESCGGAVGSRALSQKKKSKIQEFPCVYPESSNRRFHNFLRFCHNCGKNLEPERDIFMYRGEKAFCSQECRSQGMMLDELGHSESWDYC